MISEKKAAIKVDYYFRQYEDLHNFKGELLPKDILFDVYWFLPKMTTTFELTKEFKFRAYFRARKTDWTFLEGVGSLRICFGVNRSRTFFGLWENGRPIGTHVSFYKHSKHVK